MQKQTRLLSFLLFATTVANAQNVGIGTAAPQKKLSIAGSVLIDQENTNAGTLDSAGLVFGSTNSVGLSSNRSNAAPNKNGLDVWTGGQRRIAVSPTGNVGIGVDTPGYKLQVNGWTKTNSFTCLNAALFEDDVFVSQDVWVGNSAHVDEQLSINGGPFNGFYRFTVNDGYSYFGGPLVLHSYLTSTGNIGSGGDITAQGWVYGMNGVYGTKIESYGNAEIDSSLAVGGNPDPAYRLRVYDGHARIGGDFHATGNVGVSGLPDNNYKLRVWGGPSRFGGDVEVTGNLTVGQINGTGAVRSQGPSPLRIGFDTEVIGATTLLVNQTVDRTVNITPFSGGADDVRVSISQFVPDPAPGYANWNLLTMYIHSVDALNNTAKLRITNTSSAAQSIKGTLYLLTVAKN